MKYGLYSIRDFKTGFLPPTYDINDESAIRNFEHACLNSDSLFFSHPQDYALYRIGSFDTDSGRVDLLDPLPELVTASETLASFKASEK